LTTTPGSILLDTTIVIDHLRGNSPGLAENFEETAILYLPVTALGELIYGAHKSAFTTKGLAQIEDFLQLCAILGVGERTARHYGRLSAELALIGKPIPQNDLWIAAIAIEHNLPLATHDQHFSFVPGLTLLN
jgi:tRNA(fMet)-specific endonuclease VapC